VSRGHHDESDTLRIHLLQLMTQDSEQNSFRMIQIEQPTSSEARERDRVNGLLIVGNRTLRLLIHIRVAVFACKQGRETAGGNLFNILPSS
jgi:hypothetical protein